MKLLIALVAVALCACSSVGEVLPTGANTFTVSCGMSGNFPSWPEVKALCIKRANEYCDKRNKTMTVGSWDTHGARGWTPLNAELAFTCATQEAASK